MDHIREVAAFIVVLGVLVFVHEMGHYLAARWRGVYVEAFSLGFGKAFASWTDRTGTVWKLCWLPLGGYVKLHGHERADDVSPEVRATWKDGQTYQGKSVLSRAIIIGAGPAANFLLAIVLFAALFGATGQPVPVEAAVIGTVSAGGAAERAGLQPADRIDAIDGVPVVRFADLQRIVAASPDKPLNIRITRAGQEQTVAATSGSREVDGARVGLLGVSNAVEYKSISPWQAVTAGAEQTWQVTAGTASALGQIVTGRRGTEDLGGPIKIAQLSGQFAKAGLASLVGLIAVLSVNLGLLNLIPIPVLDGGHLLFLAGEAVAGRPLPPRAQDYSTRAGLALLACLFVFVTWNDISQTTLFRWVTSLIG